MKILIVGNGAREHALAWKLRQSPQVTEIFIAPGNYGTEKVGKNVPIAMDDLEGLKNFALNESIGLTVIGPEAPLVAGVTDVFRAAGLSVIGPDQNGAQLEGSKDYAKQFMVRHGIPTAAYATYTDYDQAVAGLKAFKLPVVVKADGLAAGKGVIIALNEEEALDALKLIFIDQKFGESGHKVVLEEFLEGVEVSILCLTDGKTILPLETAQDYKRAFDNDEGPNTGGMGTYSPSRYLVGDLYERAISEVVEPTLKGIQADGYDFRGIVFIGIMITSEGPKVLEYNCRFGDPETQSVLARLESDLYEVFAKMNEQKLSDVKLQWSQDQAVSVVIASGGYPDDYASGLPVTAPERFSALTEAGIIFAAGLKSQEGKPVTAGGRVLTATALGATFDIARERAYQLAKLIHFESSFYRNDIGK